MSVATLCAVTTRPDLIRCFDARMVVRRRIQRFEIIEQLGEGGMGVVYRARDPQLERDVAIKLLLRPAARTPELSENDTVDLRRDGSGSSDELLREARMMAQLSHPNVLPVYEVGLSDGTMFVVMEYIAGANLRTWLDANHSTAEILDAFVQAARGLAAAHARGIVHRDFKPENALIGRDGRVRVADFGLSRLTTSAAGAMVKLDDGKAGTPRYMAPELWRGDPATPASDVYAFCAALKEATDGRELPPAMRARIDAGVAELPAARPELDELLVALSGQPSVRRAYRLGAGVAVMALGIGGVALMLRQPDEPKQSCAVAPSYFTGRWDEDLRGKLQASLLAAGESPAAVQRILTEVDQHAAAIGREVEATCVAERDGELGHATAQLRRACLDRRTFDMGGAVKGAIASNKPDPGHETLTWWAPVAQCMDSTQPPVADLRAEEQRYAQYFVVDGTDASNVDVKQGRFADQAVAAGDTELAAMYELRIGETLMVARNKDADAWLLRAYQHGLAIHMNDYATAALLHRSQVATAEHDDKLASELARLARDAVDKPTTEPRLRVEAYFTFGYSAHDRGDDAGAIADLQKGLDILHADGGHHAIYELRLDLALAESLAKVPGKQGAAITLARTAVDLARKEFGETSYNVAIATFTLAHTLGIAGKHAEALVARREARKIAHAAFPNGDWLVTAADMNLANELVNNGLFAEAETTLHEVIDERTLPAAELPAALGLLGTVQADLGRYAEGIKTMQRALDDAMAHGDVSSSNILDLRKQLVRALIRNKDTAEADRQATALEASLLAKPEKPELELATLNGELRAGIALLRHQAAKAEQLTRAALASWTELQGDPDGRINLEILLVDELLEQGRWQDAKDQIGVVRDDARQANPDRADLFAELDAKLARAEEGLDHHDQDAETVLRSRKR